MKKLLAITLALILLTCILPMAQAQEVHKATDHQAYGSYKATGQQAYGSHKATGQQAYGSHKATGHQSYGSHKATGHQAYGSHKATGHQAYGSHKATGHQAYGSHKATGQQAYGSHKATGHQAYGSHKATGQQAYGSHKATGHQAYGSHKATGQQAYGSHKATGHSPHARMEDQAEQWRQWAKQMQQWARGYEKWAESDEFKKWQKDLQQWAQNLAKFQTSALSGSGDPGAEPGPMPVMPTMPPMPVNAVTPVLPVTGVPEVTPPTSLPTHRSIGTSTDTGPSLPGETASTGRSARDVEVKKDKDGKYVATRQMQFVSKVETGAPLVIRNNIGRIIVRPSKDGQCDIRAVIRGKAKTSNEARAKIEQVGMTVKSSEERHYLKPITRDGGEWDDLNVDLFVTVPLGIEPDLETRMGGIELYDFEGKIKAVTNMGAIKAVNTTGDLELLTKMGSIEFIAPKDLSAKLNIQTKMGSIKSDLPLEIDHSDMFRKGAQGTVGAGQGNIRMNTDMGSISLKWNSPPPDSPS